MKIALITQNASPGLLIFRKDLIETLASEQHTIYGLAADYDDSSRNAIRALGAQPVSYRLSRTGTNPITDLISIYQLYRALKSRQVDVVISFFVKPSIYGTIAAKLAGAKTAVAMVEGLGYLYTVEENRRSSKQRLLQLIHRGLSSLAFAAATKVLVLNNDDQQELQAKLCISKSKLLNFGPIGLNLNDFSYHPAKPNKPIHFLFVGRILYDKGVKEFIEAAKLVIASGANAKFTILGALDTSNPSGLQPNEFAELISTAPIEHHGHVDDVRSWMANSDVFVLPSYREGYPRSTQEAMAIGRPIITTNVNGCRETVREGVNGFIVEPRQKQALAKAMAHFIENPADIAKMGQQSRVLAEKLYDASKINHKLMGICGIPPQ